MQFTPHWWKRKRSHSHERNDDRILNAIQILTQNVSFLITWNNLIYLNLGVIMSLKFQLLYCKIHKKSSKSPAEKQVRLPVWLQTKIWSRELHKIVRLLQLSDLCSGPILKHSTSVSNSEQNSIICRYLVIRHWITGMLRQVHSYRIQKLPTAITSLNRLRNVNRS
jgi:hypothetical protein